LFLPKNKNQRGEKKKTSHRELKSIQVSFQRAGRQDLSILQEKRLLSPASAGVSL